MRTFAIIGLVAAVAGMAIFVYREKIIALWNKVFKKKE